MNLITIGKIDASPASTARIQNLNSISEFWLCSNEYFFFMLDMVDSDNGRLRSVHVAVSTSRKQHFKPVFHVEISCFGSIPFTVSPSSTDIQASARCSHCSDNVRSNVGFSGIPGVCNHVFQSKSLIAGISLK